MATLFQQALGAWRAGDAARATRLCEAVLEDAASAAARSGDAPGEAADAHRLLAEIHGAAGRLGQAIAACEAVAKLAPLDAGNLRRLGVLLSRCGRPEDAVRVLERSLVLEPGNGRALGNWGAALCALGRHAEAIDRFDRALGIDASLVPAHIGRAHALRALGATVEAIESLRRAAKLTPTDPRLFMQMGHWMLDAGFAPNAVSAFTAVLELVPGDIAAQEGRLKALMAMNHHEEAIPAIAALRAAAPWNHYLQGHELHARLQCGDWSTFDVESRDIAEQVRRGGRVDLPLAFLVHNDSPADQLICARTFTRDQIPAGVRPLVRAPKPGRTRLRIGYLSPDFRQHPVGEFIAGLFEAHDRARFEIHAFSTGADDGSGTRRRLEAGVEHFHDVADLGDEAIASRMAQHLDIAVDLGGHTLGSRMPLLAFRPAPLQVAFLGFPGTSGADFIDYIVADRWVVPEAERPYYSEQVIYLPDSCLPAAPHSVGVPTARIAAGLPATGVVLCSFNGPHKILPPMFDAWMRILASVPGSVLWLRDGPGVVKANFAREAHARGIEPTRLIHAPTLASRVDHLARLGLADLFLDTYPYNAHTTAVDALAAGVPVLTLRGRSFASRVATSLVDACGLGQLSVGDIRDYERLAVTLARDGVELSRLKAHLVTAGASSPLFDTARFCRALETAYREVWARHERNEPPAPLHVGPQHGGASPG